jgi:hypothetical protein
MTTEESPLDHEHREKTLKRLYGTFPTTADDPILSTRYRVTKWAVEQATIRQLQGIAAWTPPRHDPRKPDSVEAIQALQRELDLDWEVCGMPSIRGATEETYRVFQESVARVYGLVREDLKRLGVNDP